MISLDKVLKNGKSLILAYDHGMEHGPVDFNLKNCDPRFIFEIAVKGGFSAIAVGHGLAEKYYPEFQGQIPLIVKLNGHTSMTKLEPYSPQLCSVKRAVEMGASAVGFTIYPGSTLENKMFVNFSKIVEEAHNFGIPVILWAYPRGAYVANNLDNKTIAYAARIGLELGADMIKLQHNGDAENLKWTIANAGLAKVAVSGGSKVDDRLFLLRAKQVMNSGATGMIVGRNIWKHEHPLKMVEALKKIIFDNANVDDAIKLLS